MWAAHCRESQAQDLGHNGEAAYLSGVLPLSAAAEARELTVPPVSNVASGESAGTNISTSAVSVAQLLPNLWPSLLISIGKMENGCSC
jgi:hypothetical protein